MEIRRVTTDFPSRTGYQATEINFLLGQPNPYYTDIRKSNPGFKTRLFTNH